MAHDKTGKHNMKTIRKNDKVWYQCEECGFFYADKTWAEKCEAWCKKHHSCNLEIIEHGQVDVN